jgi:hypothetical protein
MEPEWEKYYRKLGIFTFFAVRIIRPKSIAERKKGSERDTVSLLAVLADYYGISD